MLDKEFAIPFEKSVTTMAIVVMSIGAVAIGLVGWKTVGWVIVAYGLAILYFAHLLGAAPCLDELEEGTLIPRKSGPTSDLYGGMGEFPPDLLAEYETQESAR
jgi:putative exporter of polyketide antibiotics